MAGIVAIGWRRLAPAERCAGGALSAAGVAVATAAPDDGAGPVPFALVAGVVLVTVAVAAAGHLLARTTPPARRPALAGVAAGLISPRGAVVAALARARDGAAPATAATAAAGGAAVAGALQLGLVIALADPAAAPHVVPAIAAGCLVVLGVAGGSRAVTVPAVVAGRGMAFDPLVAAAQAAAVALACVAADVLPAPAAAVLSVADPVAAAAGLTVARDGEGLAGPVLLCVTVAWGVAVALAAMTGGRRPAVRLAASLTAGAAAVWGTAAVTAAF